MKFGVARRKVRLLGLSKKEERDEYSKTKRPQNIPSNPNVVYRNTGWARGCDMVVSMRTLKIENENYSFDIEGSWVKEAGFDPSIINTLCYEVSAKESKNRKIVFINISDINPKIRCEGIPIFNDGEVEGIFQTARERTVSILKAIMSNSTLPPVEVVELQPGDFKYKLVHGCHRFHCSIAAGFIHIPAICGFDINSY